ncbi:MAG TPA: efflux RND transporter periplasmic adaptor subunit [Nitrosospira sp.]|nr:efflux RND transporter periplasmic adaptor subunit [Nitrosospira sp.]
MKYRGKRFNPFTVASLAIAVLGMALGSGYWLGTHAPHKDAGVTGVSSLATPSEAEKMGKKGSQVEKGGKDDKGGKDGRGKILYYRHPMGQPDTSPVPRKDSMGMDYLPVYEGEEAALETPLVTITPEKIQKLGVKTELAATRQLVRTVRAVATIQADERRLHTVTPKFEGWIQTLYVNTTGQTVRKGQPLMEVYSPELDSAQHEYLIAKRGLEAVDEGTSEVKAGMHRLAESALQRLRNWDIAEIDLRALEEKGEIKRYLVLRSRTNGVITEKPATQGIRFMPGDVLYKIADLSSVWVLADVFEQDLAMLRLGQAATIRIDAYAGRGFNGKVTFIYPTIAPETRTAKVRIELPNPSGVLKPAMFGAVEFATPHGKDKVLAIPESSVLDTGTRQLVLIARGEGRFEPRTVKLGFHADRYVEVLEGLAAGEAVVVSANFLIDAESNLKAAMTAFSPPALAPANHPTAPFNASADTPGLASAGHRGTGRVEAVDWTRATVTINHEPIASLGWPAMNMSFRVSDPSLLNSLKPGQQVDFEIVEKPPGEYIVTRIRPAQPKESAGHRDIGSHRRH